MSAKGAGAITVSTFLLLLASSVMSSGQSLVRAAGTAPREGADPFRVGALYGRAGIARGPCVVGEAGLWRSVDGDLLLCRSRVDGYHDQGATASAWDSSVGFGIVARPLKAKRFRFGGFVQSVYFGDRTSAVFPTDYGVMGHYYDSENGALVTAGGDVEYRIGRGLSIDIRVGKNIAVGDNALAARTWGGRSVMGGFLVDPFETSRGVGLRISRLGRLF